MVAGRKIPWFSKRKARPPVVLLGLFDPGPYSCFFLGGLSTILLIVDYSNARSTQNQRFSPPKNLVFRYQKQAFLVFWYQKSVF